MPNRKPASQPRLRLTVTAAVGKPLVPFLRKQLRAAHAMLNPPLQELSLALVGDRKMSDLHEQFMNVAGPTDVLTFPLDEDARGRVTAGEVVVCVPEARRRSKDEGTELRQEVLLYALHGMLHLCGFDDLTPAGFAKMHRTENQILTKLGVGAVFGEVSKKDADSKAASQTAQPQGSVRRGKQGASGRVAKNRKA